MSLKTNAMRILDAAGVSYRVVEYDWDEDSLDAISVAGKIGMAPEQVFKTLVLCGDRLPHFAVLIPGDQELILKRVAAETGNKSCSLLPLKDLFSLTGYQRGGCSVLAMKKPMPAFIEETAQIFEEISISPGQRGMQIIVNPIDLSRVTSARFLSLV